MYIHIKWTQESCKYQVANRLVRDEDQQLGLEVPQRVSQETVAARVKRHNLKWKNCIEFTNIAEPYMAILAVGFPLHIVLYR